jgi:hypothetical protein
MSKRTIFQAIFQAPEQAEKQTSLSIPSLIVTPCPPNCSLIIPSWRIPSFLLTYIIFFVALHV